jgi:hypothetical protein
VRQFDRSDSGLLARDSARRDLNSYNSTKSNPSTIAAKAHTIERDKVLPRRT